MSVVHSNTGDSLRDYFLDLISFIRISHNMLNKDWDVFIRWFDKCRILEPRATFMYLCRHKDKLTDSEIEYAEETYKRRLVWKNSSN